MKTSSSAPTPPVAEARPWSFTRHGITVEDPYRWLKDDSYPKVDDADVLAYLEAENRYFEAMMAPRHALVEKLFEEIKGRQAPDDASVPLREGGYFYQWRFDVDEGEGQYRIWWRWPAADAGAEDGPTEQARAILSEPALAKGSDYFELGGLTASNDGSLLAYSVDTTGAERFTMRVKALDSGELRPDVIENTQGEVVWTADDRSFFYVVLDDQWRPYQVRRHVLGEAVEDDALIYEEQDPSFFVDLSRTASKEYVVISSADHVTSEAYLVPTHAPDSQPKLVAARRAEHEYDIDHQGDRFVIRTNDTHKNARLAVAPEDDPTESAWQTLVAASDERYLRGFQVFADFIALQERAGAIDQVRLLHRDGSSTRIEFPEAVYAASIGANAQFHARALRVDYTSMTTPDTVFDFHVDDARLRTRKVQRIPSGYDGGRYRSQRIVATARDGASVPVSLVYREDVPKDGSAPLYLYGYGAYGSGVMPRFSATRLSLLERGFVFAIAHIRGGDELGYHWYEAGKLRRRTNTFNDFVDVARHLIEQGFTSAGRIAIAGGSAGGELVGAAVNQAPELWGAAVAHVPFVDVLNTMLDTSLPLTPIEWPEWGNPVEDKDAFELILSYSPYDQLKAGRYPPMLVTAGLNDPRVTYWEPAKYVARLRALKEDDNPLLLKTNLGAGHAGRSGRFDALREVAEEYAFLLWVLGLADGAENEPRDLAR